MVQTLIPVTISMSIDVNTCIFFNEVILTFPIPIE